MLERLIDEGLALKPRPLTKNQIRRFYQHNKYKSKLAELWEKKKQEHCAYWLNVYAGRKFVIKPRLKFAWRIGKNKSRFVYKLPNWQEPARLDMPFTDSKMLETRLKGICNDLHCQYELIDFDSDKTGFVIFMSLPELA